MIEKKAKIQKICLGEEPNPNYEWSESTIWGAKLSLFFLKSKTQVSKQSRVGRLESMLFHYSITQENLVDT
jgi:hypothetical protein